MSYALDQSLDLQKMTSNSFTLEIGEEWWNFTSAFGGWLLSAGVAALEGIIDPGSEVISVSATFPSPASSGTANIDTTLIRKGSRTSFWRVSISASEGSGEQFLCADMTVSTGRSKTDEGFARESLNTVQVDDAVAQDLTGVGPKWLQFVDMRQVEGMPFQRNPEPLTKSWIRLKDGRPNDVKSLLLFADSPMPRTFFTTDSVRVGSTVSFSFYMLVPQLEIQSSEGDWFLVETNSDSVQYGSYEQTVRLWSSVGQLIATSHQMAFFR